MIGVYGADGFIGRHVLRRLIAAEGPVRAVSRRFRETTLAEFGRQAEFVQADIKHPLDMLAALEGVETAIQLISTSSPGLGNEHVVADIKDNVIAHVEYLDSCLKAGVRRVVFISSGGTVYGPDVAVPTPETAGTNPISSHGVTKLFVEKYIRMYGHLQGLEYVILRLSNPYGPGQEFRKGQGLIPAILKQHRAGEAVRIFGGGTAKRDYIYIDDAVDAIVRAARMEGRVQQVVNIGSGRSHSVMEVLQLIEEVAGIQLEHEYVDNRPTDVPESRLDITKAKQVLDWEPRTGFREGLASFLTHLPD